MDLVERDRRRVWHPYAPPVSSPLFEVVEAEGVRLRLADGRELVDGMSSWWACIHGYRHPHIESALKAQLHGGSNASQRLELLPGPFLWFF